MVQLSRWQRIFIIAVLAIGVLYAVPNVLPKDTVEDFPDWVPANQINLGLDLRGGSYLLLEIDLQSVEAEQMTQLAENTRDILRAERVGYINLSATAERVVFDLRDPTKAEEVTALLNDELGDDVTVSQNEQGRFILGFTEEYLIERQASIVSQAVEIVRRRIDETGTREPSIQRQGEQRILVQVPGLEDPDELKRILGQTAKMTFRFVLDNVNPGVDAVPAGASILEVEGSGLQLVVENRVMVSGEQLEDARLSFEENQPVVSFRFDASGGKSFCDATRENVGRLFAIVLDDKVISYPRINEPICGGSGIIRGSFTQQTANDLALLLRAGALPAPLNIIEERTVGPGLGADSIEAGEVASVLAVVMVVVFMGLTYGLFGLFANVALITNLVIILGAMTAIQATLTLPGIAGIALTMGMAVDANVLIFERMREEVRNGRNPTLAIDAGYKRALTTIIDSNLTTLIAALLLYQFGTGPVKGFAVTLSLGLLTSMFTAIMLTRWMVVAWLRRNRRTALPI